MALSVTLYKLIRRIVRQLPQNLSPTRIARPQSFKRLNSIQWNGMRPTFPRSLSMLSDTPCNLCECTKSDLVEQDQQSRSRRPAVLDNLADPSQLLWVGTEFIVFIDIPWDRRLLQVPEESPTLSSITVDLLEDILEMNIQVELLLEERTSDQVLLGERLSRLIVPWALNLINNDPGSGDPEQALRHTHRGREKWNHIRNAATTLDNVVYGGSSGSASWPVGPMDAVPCGVAILLLSLEYCLRAIWGLRDDADVIVGNTRIGRDMPQWVFHRFSQRWGNDRMPQDRPLLLMTYALTREPPKTNAWGPGGIGDYAPKHTHESCSCALIKPPLDEIRNLLLEDAVPVVIYDGTGLAVRRAASLPYVAISHVWVDGLGSVTEDGLPRCQVERLGRLASKLVPDGGFWQDGLCIPRDKGYRQRAIASMARVYADAEKTLVLDEGIRTASSLSTPKEEVLLRITTSGWMHRIWTLQEGMLARELHFVLKDDIIDCTYFNGPTFDLAAAALSILEYRREDSGKRAFKRRLEEHEQPKCSVNDIIRLLCGRTTSKRKDEPIAIAGLLGISGRMLVSLDTGEDRMKSLLIQVREVPRQLVLYGWDCPRLTGTPNFTWAPQSLSEVIWPESPNSPKAICTEEGLFGIFDVVRFPEVVIDMWTGILVVIGGFGTGGVATAPQIPEFNVVMSPPYMRRTGKLSDIVVSGFLLRVLPGPLKEGGAAAVVFQESSPSRSSRSAAVYPQDGQPPPTCKYVAPVSIAHGPPVRGDTLRSRDWIRVEASLEESIRVRVT